LAKIGQIQLAQPVLTLMWSALVLGEPVGWPAMVTAAIVLVCVVLTQRSRVSPAAVTVRV
jgi:drug/metabolite transporter (DMT)-like permease